MVEIELKGSLYRIGKLSAMDQGHLARRIGPLVPKAVPAIQAFYELFKEAKGGGEDAQEIPLDRILDSLGAVSPLAEALSDLKDEAFEQIVNLSLSAVLRQQGNSWAAVQPKGKPLMFADIEFDTLLPLVVQVVRLNLGNFIAGLVSQDLPGLTPPQAAAG